MDIQNSKAAIEQKVGKRARSKSTARAFTENVRLRRCSLHHWIAGAGGTLDCGQPPVDSTYAHSEALLVKSDGGKTLPKHLSRESAISLSLACCSLADILLLRIVVLNVG